RGGAVEPALRAPQSGDRPGGRSRRGGLDSRKLAAAGRQQPPRLRLPGRTGRSADRPRRPAGDAARLGAARRHAPGPRSSDPARPLRHALPVPPGPALRQVGLAGRLRGPRPKRTFRRVPRALHALPPHRPAQPRPAGPRRGRRRAMSSQDLAAAPLDTLGWFRRRLARQRLFVVLLTLALAVAFLLDVVLGPSALGLPEILAVLADPEGAPALHRIVLFDLRLPSAVAAVLVGAC